MAGRAWASTGDGIPLRELVRRAVEGEQAAWNGIVDRFSGLVWSVCRLFRLSEADAADVAQTVWLRTVEHLPALREADALPGWLSTTTRHECLRVLKQRNRQSFYPGDEVVERTVDPDAPDLDAAIVAAERRAAVLEALALLPDHCRQLIELLVRDDRPSYAEIGARLQMPIGSIGPTRSRCLDKLRASPALRGWAPGSPTDPSEY